MPMNNEEFDNITTFKQLIMHIMERESLSQRELSIILGYSKGTVYNWINKSMFPTPSMHSQISEVLMQINTKYAEKFRKLVEEHEMMRVAGTCSQSGEDMDSNGEWETTCCPTQIEELYFRLLPDALFSDYEKRGFAACYYDLVTKYTDVLYAEKIFGSTEKAVSMVFEHRTFLEDYKMAQEVKRLKYQLKEMYGYDTEHILEYECHSDIHNIQITPFNDMLVKNRNEVKKLVLEIILKKAEINCGIWSDDEKTRQGKISQAHSYFMATADADGFKYTVKNTKDMKRKNKCFSDIYNISKIRPLSKTLSQCINADYSEYELLYNLEKESMHGKADYDKSLKSFDMERKLKEVKWNDLTVYDIVYLVLPDCFDIKFEEGERTTEIDVCISEKGKGLLKILFMTPEEMVDIVTGCHLEKYSVDMLSKNGPRQTMGCR